MRCCGGGCGVDVVVVGGGSDDDVLLSLLAGAVGTMIAPGYDDEMMMLFGRIDRCLSATGE